MFGELKWHRKNKNYESKPRPFGLRKGMRYKEIYKELHYRVSGETTEEVMEFFRDDTDIETKNTMHDMNKIFGKDSIIHSPLEVINDNGKFAIILKSTLSTLGSGTKSISRSNERKYISGINDEGEYFIHSLFNYHGGSGSIDDVLDWINRKDEGFSERLQGDILLKFVPYSDVGNDNKYLIGNPDESHDYVLVHPNHRTEHQSQLTIELGRHILLIRNIIHQSSVGGGRYFVIESDRIEIVHPEHKKTIREIPEGHFAVIANQKGRGGTPHYGSSSNYGFD